MASLRRTALAVAAVPAGLAVVLAASGWLYLVRGAGVPGPTLDALPLDELGHRDGVSLAAFAAVWLAAGLLLGLLARACGAGRLTAAFLLALGVGACAYVGNGVSVFVVRQVTAREALEQAAVLRSTWLPMVLAALGGALAGRARSRLGSRAPFLLGWLVAAAAVAALVDVALPRRTSALDGIVPGLAEALVVPLAFALLVVASGLARRRRRAWQAGVALLVVVTALDLLHGFRAGAFATGLLAVALVARRQDFDAPGDPEAAPARLLARAGLRLAAIDAFGVVALSLNGATTDRPFTLPFALRETGAALLGLPAARAHLSGQFGRWFPLAVLLAGVGVAALLLLDHVRPWRYRLLQEAQERERARAVLDAFGADTLSPFSLRADKSYFFGAGGRAFLAYRVVAGVAVVSGDPIGPEEAFGELVDRFVAFTRARDWRIAILGVSEARLDLYRSRGLHALYHGDEAVLEVERFSLEGRAIRKVRQSVTRLETAGYRAELLYAGQVGPELRARLEAIAVAWRGTAPARGFAMALDALFRLEGEDAVFAVGRGPDGKPAGFLHFAVSRAGCALSLSSMPRLRTTPNGFNEWLVCASAAWAREHGFARVSLNFAPFAALLAPGAQLTATQRVQRRALLTLKGHFQLDNLLVFNRKFLPSWERRFVVYEHRRDLPRVGIATLAAESYLPLPGRR